MGFSLEQMIKELESILYDDDQKASKKLKKLSKELAWWKNYARECGLIK
jgi:hypothetical protein